MYFHFVHAILPEVKERQKHCVYLMAQNISAKCCNSTSLSFTDEDLQNPITVMYAQFYSCMCFERKNIVMKSTGEQYRSWCYVVDYVSVLLLYILLKGETQQAYNIADASSNISIRNWPN